MKIFRYPERNAAQSLDPAAIPGGMQRGGKPGLVLSDCVGSYFPEFQRVALEMIKAQGGIFGWVSDSERFLRALSTVTGAQPDANAQGVITLPKPATRPGVIGTSLPVRIGAF